jgi:hypothetical protein
METRDSRDIRETQDTQEVPRQEWTRFFDRWSREHQGWIVQVELLGREIGEQPESSRLPLVGISADVKPVKTNIEIIAGHRDEEPDKRVARIIYAPRRVWFKRPAAPADEAIQVESEDGLVTLVTFARVPPEQVERQLPGA